MKKILIGIILFFGLTLIVNAEGIKNETVLQGDASLAIYNYSGSPQIEHTFTLDKQVNHLKLKFGHLNNSLIIVKVFKGDKVIAESTTAENREHHLGNETFYLGEKLVPGDYKIVFKGSFILNGNKENIPYMEMYYSDEITDNSYTSRYLKYYIVKGDHNLTASNYICKIAVEDNALYYYSSEKSRTLLAQYNEPRQYVYSGEYPYMDSLYVVGDKMFNLTELNKYCTYTNLIRHNPKYTQQSGVRNLSQLKELVFNEILREQEENSFDIEKKGNNKKGLVYSDDEYYYLSLNSTPDRFSDVYKIYIQNPSEEYKEIGISDFYYGYGTLKIKKSLLLNNQFKLKLKVYDLFSNEIQFNLEEDSLYNKINYSFEQKNGFIEYKVSSPYGKLEYSFTSDGRCDNELVFNSTNGTINITDSSANGKQLCFKSIHGSTGEKAFVLSEEIKGVKGKVGPIKKSDLFYNYKDWYSSDEINDKDFIYVLLDSHYKSNSRGRNTSGYFMINSDVNGDSLPDTIIIDIQGAYEDGSQYMIHKRVLLINKGNFEYERLYSCVYRQPVTPGVATDRYFGTCAK